MRIIRDGLLCLIILLSAGACQFTLVAESADPLPTLAQLQPASARPTQTPRPIASAASTPVPTAAWTAAPASLPTRWITLSPAFVIEATAASPTSADVTALPTVPPTLPPAANTFLVGRSVQGRDILAWRLGTGDKILLIMGGIHGGFEANTVMLVNEFVTLFEGNPDNVLPGITLVLVPVINPDGLAQGRRLEGRFNANGVDLNRNWGCEWSPDSYFQQRKVDPGAHAFSEPETQALAQLVRDLQPAAVLSYHSAAHGVFAGSCEGGHGSLELAAVLGEAAGYPYGQPFSAYPVNGTAASWIDGQGIPAVDVELTGTRDSEFVRNLRGLMAVQRWLAGE
jgi:hypothetical protein